MSGAGNPPSAYRAGLADYVAAVRSLEAGREVAELRLETQFESLRDWSQAHTLEEVRAWFEQQRANCGMTLEDIPLDACAGWRLDPDTGWLRHESGEFFYVQGIRVGRTASREAGSEGWDQPIVTQVGFDGGILGLARKRISGVPHYLVEAKAEPGNYELVQMSPTLQATFSNLERAHLGRKPHFAEFFEEPEVNGATVLYRQWLSEDGGRLYRKRNLGMLVELPEEMALELPPSFIWLSMWQIKECLKENAWVNPHIRGIIAHL